MLCIWTNCEHLFPILLDMEKMRSTRVWKIAIAARLWDSIQRKANKPMSLSCKTKKKKKKKQKKKKKGSSNAINASARSYISKRYDYSLKKQSCTVLSVLHVLSMSLLYRKPSRSINCQNDGLNKAWSYLRLLILQKVHYHSFGIVWFWVTWVWWVSRLF